jgi:hypothetical protein
MAASAITAHPDSPQSDCNSQSSKVTPPNQRHQQLTPPLTDERRARDEETIVRQVVRTLNAQQLPLTTFPLDSRSYKQYSEELDIVTRRHDYDPVRKLLSIRMPTPVHEAFSRLLAEHLRHELDSISRNNEKARSFASNIRSVGSSRILLREGIDTRDSAWPRRQPDEQFQHKDATYPGVVIEVSYSQDGKALRRLAQEYILYSNGDIKLVLGIDINETAECTVSTWRPRYIQAADEDIDELVVFQELASRAFRSVDGDPVNEDDRVEIPLSDFATDEIFCGDKAANVSIPFTSLAHFLKQAEEVHAAREPWRCASSHVVQAYYGGGVDGWSV